jgi:hypothetical protein
MRDEATTYLHTHAKAQNFDMDCVKFSKRKARDLVAGGSTDSRHITAEEKR